MSANYGIINTRNMIFAVKLQGSESTHTHTRTHMHTFSTVDHSDWQNVNKPVAWCGISCNKAPFVSFLNNPSGPLKLDSVKMGLWCLWGRQLKSLACADWLSPLWREVTWQSAQLAIWSPTATVTKWSPTSSGQWGNQRSSVTHMHAHTYTNARAQSNEVSDNTNTEHVREERKGTPKSAKDKKSQRFPQCINL